MVWETFCKRFFTEGKELNEREIEQYTMNPTIDRYIKKMSRYLLYFRMGNTFEWELNEFNGEAYDIINKNRAVHKLECSTRSIASKNVFKGNVRVELICSYQTNKCGWFTFGIFSFFSFL